MDKLYHFISFALASILLLVTLIKLGHDKLAYVSLIGLLVFAIVSEIFQPLFGRVYDVGDIVANLGGIAFPFLVGAIWFCRGILKDR